ncbi:MAG: hypothetical protein A3I44_04820 [Candidatus Sungbacteria bacterium RIFCSPLOWO2_02_FULL_51_17]|uniref:Uncharacterized protein n=1 Tax=Candidatus Sungbacteria bacterium RIFCSPHIGHO2_02_FULL_51_29 TaxID=1802273 RepID=A0A1G2KPB6_9BACT|nr:MAG: hypothetical protein A2676_00160 [Candidatus Sungbacteria bacterium RIFCSPHIGHO2_01_FULL_51_22]OHA01246.1 MAG: hypothetical protein A3C16_02860 [Candidatus Sungbacteria bacterium RIFCSPHIGHO2_02_FULL_51_29]OHA11355.1 MAG: hypothetical protein A3I44_04820 [Candidatus Sungbacteria bacterium RIFCSPLOWO2_02_FULL_51_17]
MSMAGIKRVSTKDLIGMKEKAAIAAVKRVGMVSRVMWRDGTAFMGTMDYRTDRVNLGITKGKVTGATIG